MRRLVIVLLLWGVLPAPAFAGARQSHQLSPREAETRSDFNGDGFSDLAVGIKRETLHGMEEAGAVSVLYGSSAGLQAGQPDDQLWTQDSPGVKDEVEALDRFGSALAAGDFNEDGYADLAIGVPSEGFGSVDYGAGVVEVLYGSPAGLQADGPDDQLWSQDSPGVQDRAGEKEYFGTALSGGDFNGDGFADLAVGVIDESGTSENDVDSGAVNVLYGSNEGLQVASPQDQIWSQASPGVKGRPEGNTEACECFGGSLANSDFNGDGFDDLAIGVYGEGDQRKGSAGAVAVLYGSGEGLQADAPDDQLWSQDSPGVRDHADGSDIFGVTVAAGDFNGDGYGDLGVGAQNESAKGGQDGGIVEVLYGAPLGLQAFSPDDQLWSQASMGVKDRFEDQDLFGRALGVADFNGDGFGDLAVGVSENSSGAAAVLYGSAAGLQSSAPDDQLWSQASPGVKGSPGDDGFGRALAAADFNGDAVDDLAVGVPFEEDGDPGAVAVLYGTTAGLQADAPDDQLWSQASPGVKGRPEDSDNFGLALGSG
jgi:FG-GAP repeat protein